MTIAKNALFGIDVDALDNAWDIFEVNDARSPEIQRVDEVAPVTTTVRIAEFAKCFFSDVEAIGYVFTRAIQGDLRSANAIKACYGIDVTAGS